MTQSITRPRACPWQTVVLGLVPRHGTGAGRAEDGTGTAPAAAVEAACGWQVLAMPSDSPG